MSQKLEGWEVGAEFCLYRTWETNGHRPGKDFLVLRQEVTLREAEGIHVTDLFRGISCEGPPKNNQTTRTIQLKKKSLRAYCVLVLGEGYFFNG